MLMSISYVGSDTHVSSIPSIYFHTHIHTHAHTNNIYIYIYIYIYIESRIMKIIMIIIAP
jgi:hypothetical protein